MPTLLQRASRNPSLPQERRGDPPSWLRLLALLCLLLVCVMSTMQVCHTHVDVRLKQSSHSNDPAPEDHCPLCVAMHSALPADIQVAPEPVISVSTLESVAADAERLFRWRFEMASRPPPPATPSA